MDGLCSHPTSNLVDYLARNGRARGPRGLPARLGDSEKHWRKTLATSPRTAATSRKVICRRRVVSQHGSVGGSGKDLSTGRGESCHPVGRFSQRASASPEPRKLLLRLHESWRRKPVTGRRTGFVSVRGHLEKTRGGLSPVERISRPIARWSSPRTRGRVGSEAAGEICWRIKDDGGGLAAFSRAIELRSEIWMAWLPNALLQLKAGQTEDYRRLVSTLWTDSARQKSSRSRPTSGFWRNLPLVHRTKWLHSKVLERR